MNCVITHLLAAQIGALIGIAAMALLIVGKDDENAENDRD